MPRVKGKGGQAVDIQQSNSRAGAVRPAKVDALVPTARHALRPRHRNRERSKMLAFAIGILVAVACLAVFSRQIVSVISSSDQSTPRTAESERTGKIVLQDGSSDCKQKKFDNQSGLISDDTSPCSDRIVLDAHGAPVPVGTIHRLDAISKSFSNH